MNTPVYPNKTLNQQTFHKYFYIIFDIILIDAVPLIAKIMPREVNVNKIRKTQGANSLFVIAFSQQKLLISNNFAHSNSRLKYYVRKI